MRTTLVTLTLALAGLSLTACGGDDPTPAETRAAITETPAADVSGDPDTWPLTGLPAPDDDGAVTNHPVFVLKMDNTASSAPQLGLSAADLVVEELVEGGSTRLAAFYYSDIPGDVGPVRSMRASDIGIVSPVGATMVTSGAAAVTISRLRDAKVKFVTEGSAGFFRESTRSSPYNLMTNLKDVAKAAKQKPGRPGDYLPFGDEADLPKGVAATDFSAVFSGGHTTTWSYDKANGGGTYVNENTFAADGDEFPADTVLVLRVKVGDAGYTDPAGNPVPETKLAGKGSAMLFHGGRLVRATWHKDGLDDALTLTTDAGELSVPAGRTWIELVPADGGDVTVGE